MKIVFANFREPYPFILGGDGVNIHTYFQFFQKRNHQCTWVGPLIKDHELSSNPIETWRRLIFLFKNNYRPRITLNFKHGLCFAIRYDNNYTCYATSHRQVIQKLQSIISDDFPDLIFTQLDGATEIIEEALKKKIPTIIFANDCEKPTIEQIKKINSNVLGVVCVSKYVKLKLKNITNKPIMVLYPPENRADYYVSKKSKKMFITCINPVKVKGGKIFEKIVQSLPNEIFLVAKGWYDPIKDNLDFTKYNNVVVLEKQFDPKIIYQQTKLLLVPSLWEEAIPRVITEAGINGIPTIASNRGGISEAIGNSGILIKNPRDISSWIKSITWILKNKKEYKKMSLRSKKYAEKFYVEIIGLKLEEWLLKVLDQKKSIYRKKNSKRTSA
ncbi:MAG: glycosyltransferase family 4 protein [Patescibacteria group bacterium]